MNSLDRVSVFPLIELNIRLFNSIFSVLGVGVDYKKYFIKKSIKDFLYRIFYKVDKLIPRTFRKSIILFPYAIS
jgi:hypothetical protein